MNHSLSLMQYFCFTAEMVALSSFNTDNLLTIDSMNKHSVLFGCLAHSLSISNLNICVALVALLPSKAKYCFFLLEKFPTEDNASHRLQFKRFDGTSLAQYISNNQSIQTDRVRTLNKLTEDSNRF